MRCVLGAHAERKPRRSPARGFSRHGRGVAEKPGDHMSNARLTISRGAPGEERTETHEVPFEAGQSVLDALRWIRAHRDPTLAIRYSCTSANTCKECMVSVDGKTVYACT